MAEAAPKKRKTHPQAKALVGRVMEILGVTTARELAIALNMTAVDDERKVRSWVSGEHAPTFYGTMRLLTVAGCLRADQRLPISAADARAAAVRAQEVARRLGVEPPARRTQEKR